MARLKRDDPLPLYVQLFQSLRTDIGNSRLKPHQQLPAERELCLRFGVSRMTVRQALTELVREGLIYSRVGKGTFVSEPKIDHPLKTLAGFSQEVLARGSRPSSRVVEARLHPAGADLAAWMRLAAGTEIVTLTRVRLADGIPLAIETVSLPHPLCPNLLRRDFGVESLYQVLDRDYGHRLTRAEQTIESVLANPRELALLELVPPAPLLILQRATYTDQDQLVIFGKSAYRADRYKFRSGLEVRSDRNTALQTESYPQSLPGRAVP